MLPGLGFTIFFITVILIILHLVLYKKCLVYRFIVQRIFKISGNYVDPNNDVVSHQSFEMESSAAWSSDAESMV